MAIRYSRIILLAAMALLATLATFGNVTDYGANLAFVQHTLRMDTVFPDTTIRWRAIESPFVHHAAYALIIAMEAATALLCWIGAWRMWRSVRGEARAFNRAKAAGIAGLTLGFVCWQVGFMTIGGEWFGMWMSDQWNGVPSAFRYFAAFMLALIHVAQRDGELEA